VNELPTIDVLFQQYSCQVHNRRCCCAHCWRDSKRRASHSERSSRCRYRANQSRSGHSL